MSYQIGQVAKLLGISTDALRFYEREGLITPRRKPGSEYREYSTQDIFLLWDILFYRSVDMSLEEIRGIHGGFDMEETQKLIGVKKEEVRKQLEKYHRLLVHMEDWEKLHREAREHMDRISLRPMPTSFRGSTFSSRDHVSLEELQAGVSITPENAYFVVPAFSCGLAMEELRFYFTLDSGVSAKSDFPQPGPELVREEASQCYFTVCCLNKRFPLVLSKMREAARKDGKRLLGTVYGRESITVHRGEDIIEYYRIYMPFENGDSNV